MSGWVPTTTMRSTEPWSPSAEPAAAAGRVSAMAHGSAAATHAIRNDTGLVLVACARRHAPRRAGAKNGRSQRIAASAHAGGEPRRRARMAAGRNRRRVEVDGRRGDRGIRCRQDGGRGGRGGDECRAACAEKAEIAGEGRYVL